MQERRVSKNILENGRVIGDVLSNNIGPFRFLAALGVLGGFEATVRGTVAHALLRGQQFHSLLFSF